ncbi:hypothetical protein OIU77_003102 [Salix suchowensis]|uniref:Uncharacterized protein n=1 Tax=Salix suchowensis TaxID=1278906 RepID=A0ABQ9B0T4_9ROSI|nr:hypothetical protein OIU77_003102 [Salix suchowensis]
MTSLIHPLHLLFSDDPLFIWLHSNPNLPNIRNALCICWLISPVWHGHHWHS